MKRKRHTPEEIIKKLREAAALLAGGQGVEEVCKKLEVSPPTYHRWRQEYGGAKEETVKRLKWLPICDFVQPGAGGLGSRAAEGSQRRHPHF